MPDNYFPPLPLQAHHSQVYDANGRLCFSMSDDGLDCPTVTDWAANIVAAVNAAGMKDESDVEQFCPRCRRELADCTCEDFRD